MLTATLLALCSIFGALLVYEVSSFEHFNAKVLRFGRLSCKNSLLSLTLSLSTNSAFSSDSYNFYPIATLKNNNSSKVAYGGYFDAARCMLLDSTPAQPSDAPIRVIKICGERTLDFIYHQDVLLYLKDACKIPYEQVVHINFGVSFILTIDYYALGWRCFVFIE